MFGRLFLIFVVIILTSCATQYRVVYETYIENSADKKLTFQDDNFYFEFFPVPNGIYFRIKNLTNDPAFLVWDGNYFINPSNNSSKLLNTDVMFEEEDTKEKSKYESILPPNAYFSRFTTSALNVNKFTLIRDNYTISYMRIFETDIINTYKDRQYNTFFSYGRYWPHFGKKINKSKLDGALEKIRDYVQKNNNMGLGFLIRLNKKDYNYKFNFKFKEVKVYEVTQKGGAITEFEAALKIVASMKEENNWYWQGNIFD